MYRSAHGPPGAGATTLGWMVDHATVSYCAVQLGVSESSLERTAAYTRERVQFGRPIGSFQAIQHHCANMATDVDGSRFITYQAAWRLSEDMPCDREVSMAKAWVSAAYGRVCATAHQCHGAIGFTKEHDLQLYTRRAKVHELTYGDANHHKEIVLQHLDDE